QTVDGTSYYFLSNGALAEGWVTENGCTYYYVNNQKVTTATTIGGSTYYFKSDGTLPSGWQTIDEEKYYYNQYGTYVTGWQTIGGNRYYFNGNGTMAKNTTVELYTLNANGVASKSPASLENLNLYVTELLNTYGWSDVGAYNAVRNTLSYKLMDQVGTIQDRAVYAINNRRGACYHFASLGYVLLSAQGYNMTYINGYGRRGTAHAWLGATIDGVMYYYDFIYSAQRLTLQEILDMGYTWPDMPTAEGA
ncbi:MAG: transglutaminase domain-containing protein, partial [Eubacteriales bacterium]